MVRLAVNIPDEHYNKLNNFYLENFGYEIHTQVLNFIHSEYLEHKDCSDDKIEPQPIPTINRNGNKWKLIVKYPDNTTLGIALDSYEWCMDFMNEWSKYSYDPEKYEDMIFKFKKTRPCIYKKKNKWAVQKNICGVHYFYGSYATFEDAEEVQKFLKKEDWNLKYTGETIREHFEDCGQYEAGNYLLKIVRGELEYEVD